MTGTPYIPNEVTTLDEIRQIRDTILRNLVGHVQQVTDKVLSTIDVHADTLTTQAAQQVKGDVERTSIGLRLHTSPDGVFVDSKGRDPFSAHGHVYALDGLTILRRESRVGIYKVSVVFYNDDGELVALNEPVLEWMGGVDVHAQGVRLDLEQGLRVLGGMGTFSGIVLHGEMPVEAVLPPLFTTDSHYTA